MTSLFCWCMSCVSGATRRLLLQKELWVLLVVPDNYAKTNESSEKVCCQGSLAMLEVNQQEEEKNFSYRLLTGSSFILSIIHPNE